MNYATGGGTAVAGKDYVAATGTLTFQPGQTDLTFPVTILSNPSLTASSVTANLTLSQPTGGATLGTITTATLTINNNLPPILQFNSASYSVSATASSALVTVVRGGGDLGTTVQVGYITFGGTAVPGTTYTPVSGTLTFLPNQTKASFSVPVIPSTGATTVQTVGLALSGPTAGTELGATSTAALTIVPGSTNNPGGPVDHVSPVVTGEQLVFGPGGIAGVVFSFSKPMDPTRAADLGNYGYFARIAGPDGLFSNPDDGYVALSSASYNSANASVTVIPKSPLPLGTFVQIALDGLATPLLNRGLADTSGNLLAGQSGVPGSPYVVTFGVGTQLHYADSRGKSVSLSLSGGGEVEIFRGPTGDVQSASLIGAVPRRSVLTLTASGGNASTTYLPPFQNASGVTFRYKPSAAAFRKQPQLPAPTVAHHAAKPVRVVRPAVRHKR